MNIEEKNLALAELMGWKLKPNMWREPQWFIEGRFTYLRPYNKEYIGKSQFAYILLKFPEVMMEFVSAEHDEGGPTGFVEMSHDHYKAERCGFKAPTQETILDAVLVIKGKWVK